MATQARTRARRTIQITFEVDNAAALTAIKQLETTTNTVLKSIEAETKKNRNSWQQWAQGVNAAWQMGKDFFQAFSGTVRNGLREMEDSARRVPGAFSDIRESFGELDQFRDLFSVWVTDIASGLIPELGNLGTTIDDLAIERLQGRWAEARDSADQFTDNIQTQHDWLAHLRDRYAEVGEAQDLWSVAERGRIVLAMEDHIDLLARQEAGLTRSAQSAATLGYQLAQARGELGPFNAALSQALGFWSAGGTSREPRGRGGPSVEELRRQAEAQFELWAARVDFRTAGLQAQARGLLDMFADIGAHALGEKGTGLAGGTFLPIDQQGAFAFQKAKEEQERVLAQQRELAANTISLVPDMRAVWSDGLTSMAQATRGFVSDTKAQFAAMGTFILNTLGGVMQRAGDSFVLNGAEAVLSGTPLGILTTLGGVFLGIAGDLLSGLGGGGGGGARTTGVRPLFNPAESLAPIGGLASTDRQVVNNNFFLGAYYSRDTAARGLTELQKDQRRRNE